MSALSEDPTRFDAYEALAGLPLADEQLDLHVLEWTRGDTRGSHIRLNRVTELAGRPYCNLRVIFAPLDLPDRGLLKGLLALFEHYSIPSTFLSERLQSVAHSFGARKDDDGTQYAWFHFLCKNINIQRSGSQPEIVNQNIRLGSKPQSQADYSWHRSGFFLKASPGAPSKPPPQSPFAAPADDCVTLICFGASPSLEQRFRRLALTSAWEDALEDPYVLFDVVLDELYLQLDGVAWSLAEVFGGIEGRILSRAVFPGVAADKIDFVGLHNVSKHIIYVREAADAMLLTLESLSTAHKHTISNTNSPIIHATQSALRYRRTLFQSTQLRLTSLEKRMQNIISLSFNLVTQQDSRIMQKDSSSMKTIAIMTLIFLPATTIASIFGSQFFTAPARDEDGGVDFRVSPYFWVFWVISVPVTLLVLILWRVYYRRAKNALIHGKQPGRRTGTWMSGVSV
ncbi:hypothetical protein H2199_005990 [Coniosporium tulheliwenetii]|uniref:Uncharacterized protein n=1 Tax=Coniosporium tulheliwenetii TaxID=3383036 RepID=A0ACC2YZK1_9PEZI|nr:hypothetical protein H2199_005990 [Cladosporium sp. JES 115]